MAVMQCAGQQELGPHHGGNICHTEELELGFSI